MAKGQLKIDTMFAFIALNPQDNTEGIISVQMGNQHMPLVGADMARVESLRPIAERTAALSGSKVTLAHFTVRTDIETFG